MMRIDRFQSWLILLSFINVILVLTERRHISFSNDSYCLTWLFSICFIRICVVWEKMVSNRKMQGESSRCGIDYKDFINSIFYFKKCWYCIVDRGQTYTASQRKFTLIIHEGKTTVVRMEKELYWENHWWVWNKWIVHFSWSCTTNYST